MRVIHWAVVAYLCALIDGKYRFRFHTCIKEDQPILDRENLVSLRQVAFIDDGSLGAQKYRKLSQAGIGVQHGSMFEKFGIEVPKGVESTIHFIEFYGSDYVIVINFWSRSYYFAKKGEKLNMRPHEKTIKPNFEHFVRVYFICAPGNARSALILFGDQAKLRKIRKQDGEPETPKKSKKPSTPKRKKRTPVDVKIGNSTMKKCRRRRAKRQNSKRRYPIEGDISTAVRLRKDDRRLVRRALFSMFKKIAIVFAHFGFGVGIVINCILLIVFFQLYRKLKVSSKVEKSDSDEKLLNNRGGSDTVETTKTKSDQNGK